MGRWGAWLARRRIPPFAWVTAAAGVVIAASGLLDAITSTDNPLGSGWTWFWIAVTLVLAATPIAFGALFVRWLGLVGASVFFVVTSVQMAVSTAPVASVNNIVLYPMFACYLGWFYRRWVARAVTATGFALSLTAVIINPLDALLLTWFNILLASVFCLEAAGYLRSRLDREITTDPLTGLLNRSGLDARIDLELTRASRTGQSVAVVIVDLDDFKRVNDERGHAEGDRRLVEFAAALRQTTRPYDLVARIGGDEFLLVLPATAEREALDVIERLRAAIPEGWSFGIAVAEPDDSAHTIRERADRRLYALKAARKQDPAR
ncbi:GGDEF domain-containing protein [Herbiconiux sp. KACC 21604]|uniref:GGDEF domain-containing protein n=1 Tax=unclassified Herbiconiux TaxID=2618217 RepID=UPI00149100C0|nr:GGDEF domain-containing protein [Herbiconiux sp. SALV-R1]QJU52698.1 GGDEF domain-containing protein [Herbiconiux sp. SALV-R1]WPO87597.1 GGDEF domain-containing protein [Herbiconiux sp. KACC 21604]